MRTLAEAAVVAAFCGLVWLPVRFLTARTAGHPFVQVVVYGAAAAATTAGAVALGAWREHLRPTVTSVVATFGGMCAFWILVRVQTGRRPGRPEALPATDAVVDDAIPVTMTRRERREARHRFGRVRRRPSAVLR